jgi:hypothetical protein
MSIKARTTAAVGSLILGALFVSPAMAQVPSTAAVPNPPPTPAQITTFSRNVGINESCTRGFLAANNNAFPHTLNDLNQFTLTAPAADLCTQSAVASAVNNTPRPTDAQIAAFSQSVGVNQACIKAFVLHASSLPQSQADLNLFRQVAPAADLCTQAAVTSAVNNAPAPTDAQIAAFSQSVGVNQTCIRAFVAARNTLPQNLSELNQFKQAAPPEDLCA